MTNRTSGSNEGAVAPDPRDATDTATWVRRGGALTVGTLAILVLAWIAIQASTVLVLIFLAVLLAAGLEPIVDSLRARFPVGRTVGILLAYATFLGSVVLIAFLVVPAALNQLTVLSRELPSLLDRTLDWAEGLRPVALSTSVTALVEAAQKNLAQAAPDPDAVVEVGFTVAEAVVGLVTMLTLVFFWLTEHALLQRYALAFVPESRRGGAREAWNEVEERLGLWVRGQLLVMGSIAVLTGILYAALGLPSFLFLAITAGLAEAIPVVGPTLGAIPAVLVVATTRPELLVVVIVAYIAIQFVEGNVLVPMIMKNTVGVSPFLVLASILIGAAAGGVVGAFLAVPVVAAADVILERLQAREIPVAQAPTDVEPDDEVDAPVDTASLDVTASDV